MYYVDSSLPAHNMSFKSKALNWMDAFSLNISNCHVTKLETSNLEVDPSR